MLEQLRLILEAETQARQEVDEAREAARQIVRLAEEEARQHLAAARASCNAVAREVEEAILQEARTEAENLVHTAQVRLASMRSRAAPRRQQAVEAILQALLRRARTDGA